MLKTGAGLWAAEYLYPEFLLRNRNPPEGGQKLFLRETCKFAIKIVIFFGVKINYLSERN